MPSTRKPSHAAEELERRKKTSPTKSIIMGLAVVIAVIAVGYALYMRFGKAEEPTEIVAPPTDKIPSIAVLPFINMSDDTKQDYFCDGMSEEITNALTNVGGLRVIARTSTFVFKDKQKDIAEIGRKLNVETVLEGSVRKADNQLRITAQLINVADESHIWSDAYNRELEDVFAIQEEISLAIVEALKVKLLRKEKAAIVKRPTENAEAYELYLMGRHHLNLLIWKRDWEKGLPYFQQAIEKDPDFALAYVGLAEGYYGSGKKNEANAALEKANYLDDTLAEVHATKGYFKMHEEWDFTAAEAEFKRALELNPGYIPARYKYAEYLRVMGRYNEDIEQIKRVRELDPLTSVIYMEATLIYTRLDRFDEAMENYKKAIEINPGILPWVQARIYYKQGKYSEALDVIYNNEGEKKFSGTVILVYIYGIMGERDKAEELMQQLLRYKKPAHSEWYYTWLAIAFTGLGENDKAIECLNNAYEEHEGLLVYIKDNFEFDPLRSYPSFKALMKKMGLPE